MKTSDYIVNTIDRFPKGYVFTYLDFPSEVHKKEAIIKALNRMATSERIVKLSKGKFYKPEKTVFGRLEPNQFQVVKDLLNDNGKTIGYLTGLSVYNQLSLTTQISNTIQIGRNEVRPKIKRERYTISFIKQKNTITKDNIPFLQILDAIRYIKKIPDASISFICLRFKSILQNLSEKELSNLTRLALKYPPSTRAIVGALLEELGEVSNVSVLKKSLNSITKYTLIGANKVLIFADKWNIE